MNWQAFGQWLVQMRWVVLTAAVTAGVVLCVASVAFSGCADSRDARVRAGLLVCRDQFLAAWETATEPRTACEGKIREAVFQRDQCEIGVMAAAVRVPGTAASISPLPRSIANLPATASPPANSVGAPLEIPSLQAPTLQAPTDASAPSASSAQPSKPK